MTISMKLCLQSLFDIQFYSLKLKKLKLFITLNFNSTYCDTGKFLSFIFLKIGSFPQSPTKGVNFQFSPMVNL